MHRTGKAWGADAQLSSELDALCTLENRDCWQKGWLILGWAELGGSVSVDDRVALGRTTSKGRSARWPEGEKGEGRSGASRYAGNARSNSAVVLTDFGVWCRCRCRCRAARTLVTEN